MHPTRSRKRRYLVENLEPRLFLSTTVITADVADNGVDSNGTSPYVGNTNIRVGDNGTNTTERNAVLPFKLPTLPAGATITSVTANFNLESIGNAGSLQGTMDVYGLGRRAASKVLAGDYYRGAYGADSTDATVIQGSVATKTTAPGILSLNATGQANLLSYINAQYAGGAGAGQYVFLRLNHQVEELTSRYWVVSSANSATPANRPTITVTWEVGAAAPSNLLGATTGSNSIGLTWQDNASNETGFRIDRSTDGTNFTTVGNAAANSTSFTDTTASADTKYFYRVYAMVGTTASNPSNTASATTLPTFLHTLWVDGSFAGTSTGTYAAPYKTIASALTAAVTGDGVVLRGGTYHETVSLAKTNLTLMGTPGERAIISGFADITGWTLLSGNTYTTTLNWNPTTLYVGFDPMDIAHSPNTGWWTGATITQDTASGTTIISDPAHLAGIPSLVGGSIHAHDAAGNNWATKTILAHDTVNGTITTQAYTSLATGDYYMVKNTPNLIDVPGEWAVVNNGNGTYTVFFNPKSAADLSKTQARKSTGQQIRVAATGSGAVLRNLEVTGNTGYGVNIGNSTATRATNITLRDSVIHNNGNYGVWVRYAANINVTNNIVLANSSGISISSTQTALVDRNDVGFNAVDGVVVSGDVSGRQPGDVGFDPSDSVTVSNNYIHDEEGFAHSDGIQMYRWPANSHILNNFITRVGQGLMTEEIASADFIGNTVWNTGAFEVIFGHSNSSNWTVRNNTIGGAGYGAFSFTASGYNVTNNVFYNQVALSTAAAYTGDYNLFYNPAPGGVPIRTSTPSKNYTSISTFYTDTGDDQHSQIGNPQFTSAQSFATVIGDVLKSTTTSMELRSATGFAVGDHIQINGDGVVRTVTSVNTTTKIITWDIALPMPPLTPYVIVENFKTATNFALDLRLQPTSPANTMSSTSGPIGSSINTQAYIAGDYNNDGVRDIPALASDIAAGIPGQNEWTPPTFQ